MADEGKKPTVYSNDDFMKVAMDAWCEQYKPGSSDEDPETKTMYEILEALDSIYGYTGAFDGQQVFQELRVRGYLMRFDPMTNQFKIMVKN